jgi:hypothetical protein
LVGSLGAILFARRGGFFWSQNRNSTSGLAFAFESLATVDQMDGQIHQLASAMLALTFAGVMLVGEQLFTEYRATHSPLARQVTTASLPL